MPKTVTSLGLKEASQAIGDDGDRWERWERLKSAECPKCNSYLGWYYTYLYLPQFCREKGSKVRTEQKNNVDNFTQFLHV